MKHRKYILQKQDFSCAFITLLNFHIHKTGKTPIRYNTKRYWNFLKEHDGKNGACLELDQLAERIGLKYIDCPKFKSLGRFKSWLIQMLKERKLIDLAFYNRNGTGGLHSTLVVSYNSVFNSFKCINAQLNTNESPIEYLTFEQLMDTCYFNDTDNIKTRYAPYFNRKENSSLMALCCINNTKVVTIKIKKTCKKID